MKQNWKQAFGIIWTGQLFSILTSSMVNFSVILWLSMKYDSAQVLANAAIAGMLPQSILGLFVGVYVDRWNRKLTMIISDCFIAVCTLGIALIFYLESTNLWLIYLLLAFRSVGSSFHMPAMQASIPLLAPKLELLRISGVNQMIESISTIAGPALGAFAISVMSIEKVMLFDAAGALIAVISMLFIHIPNHKEGNGSNSTEKANVFHQIGVIYKIVTQHKGLTYLFLVSTVSFFCMLPGIIVFPLYTMRHFNGGPFEVSVVEIVVGVGTLLGGAFLGIFKPTSNKVGLVNISNIILGLTFVISGFLLPDHFWFFVTLTAIGGFSWVLFNAGFDTILQETIDPAYLGRVFSFSISISILPSLIGLLSAGYLSENIGISKTLVILGGLIVLVGIIPYGIKDMMKLGNNNKS